MDQLDRVANPARGQLSRKTVFFSCPRSRRRVWSRETGLTVPSRVSPLILHTQAEYSTYSRVSSRFPRRRPLIYPANSYRVSPEFYQVTQLRTNGVHCRESAGTRRVDVKVIPVTGAASSGLTMDASTCGISFPTPTTGM